MLFFVLELPDTIVYKRSKAFVDFNFTFLFIHVGTRRTFGAMARAPVLFFVLELPDTIVYKRSKAFVDFNFTFLFIHVGT